MTEENEKYPGLWGLTNHLVHVIDAIAKEFDITTQESSKLVRSAVDSTPVFNRIKKSVEKRLKEGACRQS